MPRLVLKDAFSDVQQADQESFGAIVISEVLEHLERPADALKVLFSLCKLGGKIWVNAPANSPASDHLFLFTQPTDAVDMVRQAGFDVIHTAGYSMAGASIERAVRQKLTLSCVVIGQRPAY